ncbi:MAG: DNA repair protein RadC [Lysobacterales bacterium]
MKAKPQARHCAPALMKRLKQQVLQQGAAHLSPVELVALLIGPGGNSWEVAANTLHALGGLAGIQKASAWDFKRQRGIGESRALRLLCAMEVSARLRRPPTPEEPIVSPGHSRRYFSTRLVALQRESFACLYLDTRHRPVDFHILFQGTIDCAAVYPREVARHCLERNASAVIVGHNHPSGDAQPSQADITITRRLKDALGLLDIRLLDHLIIADSSVYSFAEHGQL